MTSVQVPWIKLHPMFGILGVIATALITGNAAGIVGAAVPPQYSVLATVLIGAVLAWMVHTFPDAGSADSPAPGDAASLSGASGVLNGHTLGQGFIDACKSKGWSPLTDEIYTLFPGNSYCLTTGGELFWSPTLGVKVTSFDQG